VRPPASWRQARVTLAIAGVTALAWLLGEAFGLAEVMVRGGFIPARASVAIAESGLVPFFLTPLTATLIHASLVHLAFNLLMHTFCGRSVEPIIGGPGLLLLYLVGAYAAAAAQWAFSPMSVVPMVGASGAASALLGAYAMFFGRLRVKIANDSLAVLVNALWLAAAWIGLQLLIGLTDRSGIAVAAHVGGFLAGLIIARPLLALRWRKA
jgi:membrane associated rhomboid family serine protease